MATIKPDLAAIATSQDGRDITRPYVSAMARLEPQDGILQLRGSGNYAIYGQVLNDDHVAGCFEQRRRAVTSCEWQVEAGGTQRRDKQAADFLRAQLAAIGWDNVTDKMLFGVFYGYAVAECLWARDGAQVVLDQLRVRDRRRFAFDGDFRMRLLTMQNYLVGEALPERKFWAFATGADHDDDPYGLGLAHWLYWLVLFKRRGIQFWLTFLDKFGSPTAKGTFTQAASAADKQRLLDALQAIRTDSAIIIPEGMTAELLEAARSGTSDYGALCAYMDDAIARRILGQTLSGKAASTGLGSGVADLQDEVRKEIVKADADLVCDSFNRTVAAWLTDWNFPGAAVPRVWRVTDDGEDLNALATRDVALAGIGWASTPERIKEVYGDGYVQGAPVAALVPGADSAAAAAFAEGDQPDPPALQADRASAEVSPALDAWIAQIRALVDQADSLADVRDGIMKLIPGMRLDQYTKAMQQALAAAALAGRYEILQEAAGG